MERKGNVADKALFPGFRGSLQEALLYDYIVVGVAVQGPEMVEIHMVCTQAGKALLQALSVAVGSYACVYGAFGGDEDPVPETFYRMSQGRFAVLAAVSGSGVEIVHAVLIGVCYHFVHLVLIHEVLLALLIFRKAHASKSQCRNLLSCFAEFTIIHLVILSWLHYF